MEERQGMICFSIEPAAACRPGCKPVGIVQQKVQSIIQFCDLLNKKKYVPF